MCIRDSPKGCLQDQSSRAQLTFFCREGKGTKVGAGAQEWSAQSAKRFLKTDSAGKFDIAVGKDLGGESLDGCGLAPGIQRQTSLVAGLLQKSFPVPTMFDRDLGQKQAAASAFRNEQAVAPDFHRVGMNRKQAGEHAQRNLQLQSFLLRHRQMCIRDRR